MNGWAPLAGLLVFVGAAGCDGGDTTEADASAGQDGGPAASADHFALASVVINADGTRTSYFQAITSLDDGPFDNSNAVEAPGQGDLMSGGGHVFFGLAEEPVWVRYSLDDEGRMAETGRISFLGIGASRLSFGNVYVDEDTAVSVLTDIGTAVFWNPSTMEIVGEVELPHLAVDGYETEVWTTTAHDGRVFVPGRWADWEGGRVREGVSITILDPSTMSVVAIAEDDRCTSAGRVVFDEAGYGYVMGDGRNYAQQMYAHAAGTEVPENCILRIPPGGTDFEEGYFYTVPSLTGGLESIAELNTARQGSGIAFSKMFYPDELPEGVEPVDFAFWNERAHRMWRIVLADPPTAEVVEGVPFSVIGFPGTAFDGKLYTGESVDGGATTDVYEIDPETNTAMRRFTMDGYFNGLFKLD